MPQPAAEHDAEEDDDKKIFQMFFQDRLDPWIFRSEESSPGDVFEAKISENEADKIQYAVSVDME